MHLSDDELKDRLTDLFKKAGGSMSLMYEQDRKALLEFAKALSAESRGIYVTLVKLSPSAETRLVCGPFERVEVDDGDIVGFVGDEPTHVATTLNDGVETPGDFDFYDRVRVTVGEPV